MHQRPPARRHDEPAESAELLRRLAVAAPGEREALRERLVVVWMPMADRLARRYRGRGESLDDLRQVAALGLVKAVRRYDPARGSAFPSFAVPTVDGELKRHFRDHVWSVHVPRQVKEARARVRAACRELGTEEPVVLAEHTGLPEDDVRDALAAAAELSPLSLDRAAGETAATLNDALGGPDPALERVVDRESVRDRLVLLPERERSLLYLRYFADMKQRDIATALGISQMHVSRLLRETCAGLRAAVLDENGGA
jgi:RNA polymerase sigma-B factor